MIEEGSAAPKPSFDDLIEIDDELAERGVEAFKRPFEAAKLWGERHDNEWTIALTLELWFRDAYRGLHPSVDFSAESFLTLSVCARGISYFAKPPAGYGIVRINPMDHVSISEGELSRIWHHHPDSFWELQWQAFDAVDLFMSLLNFHSKDLRSANMMQTAVSQLTASARQLVACELDSSLPQGMAMACELAGKSLLASNGASDKDLRDLGHNLVNIYSEVRAILPSPVDDDVKNALGGLPSYVEVRYNSLILSILSAQDIYRRALFVVADFLRRTNHSQGYWDILERSEMPPRRI